MTTLIQELAELDKETRDAYIDSLTQQELETFQDWEFWARPEQLTPEGDWTIWLILSGRGWGKTRSAAEDMKAYGLAHPRSRIAVIAPTYADARDTCIEGDSGLLSIMPEDKIKAWNRSLGEFVLTNGTRYKLFSSEEPERLRGPQHHRAWCEELCAWKYPDETWDQMMFGLRLGIKPQIVITTTPKPIKLIRMIVERAGKDVHLTKGNTFDNAANLAKPALEELKRRYLGTRQGRQELFAEILEDTPGALWKRKWIDDNRVRECPELKRIVVAVDPPATSLETSEDPAEAGIVVCGLGVDNHGYMLADYSMVGTPNEWASAAVKAYDVFQADCIVGEVNFGGEMVGTIIRNIAKERNMGSIKFKAVRASRGKQLRAEPISDLYQRMLVHHVGVFPDTEDQMCNWVPGEKSPDRLDSAVWAFTELMGGKNAVGGMVVHKPTEEEKERELYEEEDEIAWR